MSRRAFTLMELLFVVIIVGILVAIALPGFTRTTERAQQRQAWDMLQTIYASEQVFFSVNTRYSNTWADPIPTNPDLGDYMDNPNTPQTTYALTSTDLFATTFRAEASGRCGGAIVTMTIDQTRTIGGGWRNCPMPL